MWVLELGHHLLGIGDEIGGDVAAVELHALDHFELAFEALCLLDRDHAFIADLLHGLGNHFADRLVAIGRDGTDLGDLTARGDLLCLVLQLLDHGCDGEVNAALQIHRVGAGGDGLCPFAHDGVGEQGCGGGAIPSRVRSLRGDFTHHLGAHILELVLKLDLLRHRHAVLGDAGSPK